VRAVDDLNAEGKTHAEPLEAEYCGKRP
jgi:hypothetical protein